MAVRARVERIAFVGAPIAAALAYALLPDEYVAGGTLVPFTPAGKASAAIAIWMAIWWLTEAVHISVTALLPLILLPLFGATKLDAAAAPYANPLIFLFLGGFILSIGMERWNLHRRCERQRAIVPSTVISCCVVIRNSARRLRDQARSPGPLSSGRSSPYDTAETRDRATPAVVM